MKSIRTKLWLGMMVLVGIVILLLWFFQIVFLEKFYTSFEVRGVLAGAEDITADIGDLGDIRLFTGSEAVLSDIDRFAYSRGVSVNVADSDGTILYQNEAENGVTQHGMLWNAYSEAAGEALAGRTAQIEAVHPRFGNKFMILALPIAADDQIAGFMMITLPLVSIEETVNILEKQLIIITVILLIVSVIISYRLSKAFTGKILAISQVAGRYTEGDYSARVMDKKEKHDARAGGNGESETAGAEGDGSSDPGADGDEIERLAEQMNLMGDKLARNEILQRELIANVSHELRTPLTLIRGYAETLRDVTGGDPGKREKQLDIIIAESERLGIIVEDILNLSQLQAGAVLFHEEPFPLKPMLEGILSRYEPDEGSPALKITGTDSIPDNLLGDSRRIEQVIFNLVNNAMRHAGPDGQVEIAAERKKARVRISVKDNGSGIAPEDLEHIFERYYKGKWENGKKSTGTGLGLAIVKSILDMHGMPYGVESTLGKGTVFWFELKTEGGEM